MAKYDSEDLIDSILQIMQDNSALNTKIKAIDAEKAAKGKGLDPELEEIDELSYFEQTWTNKILNSSPAIFYGIEEVKSVDGGSAVAKTYTIFVEIVLTDDGSKTDTPKRIQRYTRALEELFTEAYAPAIASGQMNIDTVRPFAFKIEEDSDEEVKVGGISLTLTLV